MLIDSHKLLVFRNFSRTHLWHYLGAGGGGEEGALSFRFSYKLTQHAATGTIQ